jgi:ABC-type sugar transport system ATPase subunit
MPILELRGIVKHFGGVTALDEADFSVDDGEVMALVGDNGAGKSTLIKVISGAYAPDAGAISMQGEPVTFRSPQDAWAKGIATIYQELALAGKMTVADNIFLGRELVSRRLGIPFLSRHTMRARSQTLLRELDVHVPDIDRWVETLSGGQRQGVAIARAMNLDADLIIMDEPTAALAVAEVRKVLGFIERLRDQGKSVILISHNIQDVFAVSDRITVMRHGRCVAVCRTVETDPEDIIGLITGAAQMRTAERRQEGEKAIPSEVTPSHQFHHTGGKT